MQLRVCAAAMVVTAAFGFVFSVGCSAQTAPAVPSSSLPAPKPAPTRLEPVTIGRTTVSWTGARGLSLTVDGVPVVLQSSLNLSKEGWNGTLLDQSRPGDLKNVSSWSDAPSGGKTARVELENENVVCSYTFTVAPSVTNFHLPPNAKDGQTVDVDLVYRLKADIPGQIEYGAAYLSGPVVQGSVFTGGQQNEAQTTREVPVTLPPATRTQAQNRLLPSFNDIRFSTRLGTLSVSYTGNAPRPVIFDARGDTQNWARTFPVFWLGIGSEAPKLSKTNGEQHARFRFTIGPAPSTFPAAPIVGTLSRGMRLPDAYAPTTSRVPLVIPRPKQLTVRPNSMPFRFGPRTPIRLMDKRPGTRRAALVLQRAVQERFGWQLPLAEHNPRADEGAGFHCGVGKGLVPEQVIPDSSEGYLLSADRWSVDVEGHDEAGVLWGVQTVVQLLSADAQGSLVQPALIRDWPTLRVRAVHLFTGQNALPFHEKLIDRIYSRFKLNALFIQAEQAKWDADPDVAPSWGASKEDLKTEVAYARERGITVYPLLQSYGHMEWLFNKPQNRDFAEDPETPYSVNITNPQAVAYLEKFNGEADTLFGAPGFHAGLDEVTMRGRFPFRSNGRTFADMYVANARHWHDFFAKRGKQMWMWADMALHPSEVKPSFGTAPSAEEAAKVRAGLPKDVVMVDWQYTPQEAYPSLRKLKEAGFKNIVAATWFTPENIRLFARDAARVGALGAMQTTWAGYESKESVLDTTERKQFTAMILAAEYFWNGGDGPVADKLPYDYADVFARAFTAPNPAAYKTRPGYALRLGSLTNRLLPDFLGYGNDSVPANLPTGNARVSDGTTYYFDKGALVLSSRLNTPNVPFPTEANLTLPPGQQGELFREARLLVAATHPAQSGTRLGTLRATFASGKTADIALVYGQNIAAWSDTQSLAASPIAYRGETKAAQPFLLRTLIVTAPSGETITGLRLESENGQSAPALFGVTVLP